MDNLVPSLFFPPKSLLAGRREILGMRLNPRVFDHGKGRSGREGLDLKGVFFSLRADPLNFL